MAKAELQKSGTKITISGTDKEVAQIIKLIQGAGSKDEIRGKEKRRESGSKTSHKRRFNATDGILDLKEEDFFNKKRGLMEIRNALAERGLIYPLTTLSGIVLRLVKKRTLRRVRDGKKWEYVRGQR